jgi:hypothetical protein
MKSSPSTLSPILRSDVVGRILAELFLETGQERSLAELAQRVESSPPTVLREVDRLVTAGHLRSRRVGRARLIMANPEHPLYLPLRQMIMYAYGPIAVLPDLVETVPGVEGAYIYGSWAARFTGEPGPDPQDVDLLLLGHPAPADVYNLAREATARVGRDVNIQSMTRERWNSEDDGFVRTVRARPLVGLALDLA